jgi:hypothetical protein
MTSCGSVDVEAFSFVDVAFDDLVAVDVTFLVDVASCSVVEDDVSAACFVDVAILSVDVESGVFLKVVDNSEIYAFSFLVIYANTGEYELIEMTYPAGFFSTEVTYLPISVLSVGEMLLIFTVTLGMSFFVTTCSFLFGGNNESLK